MGDRWVCRSGRSQHRANATARPPITHKEQRKKTSAAEDPVNAYSSNRTDATGTDRAARQWVATSSTHAATASDRVKVASSHNKCVVQTSTQPRSIPALPIMSCIAVDGGVNPRKSGDDQKSGTGIAVHDRALLAIVRSDASGCSVALCQRHQPPKAGAVGQRLQRVAGQPSWTIKTDGWFRRRSRRPNRERPEARIRPILATECAPFMRGFSPPPTIAAPPSPYYADLSRQHAL